MGSAESNKYSEHTGQLASIAFSRHLCVLNTLRLMHELQVMQWKKSMPRPRPRLRAHSHAMEHTSRTVSCINHEWRGSRHRASTWRGMQRPARASEVQCWLRSTAAADCCATALQHAASIPSNRPSETANDTLARRAKARARTCTRCRRGSGRCRGRARRQRGGRWSSSSGRGARGRRRTCRPRGRACRTPCTPSRSPVMCLQIQVKKRMRSLRSERQEMCHVWYRWRAKAKRKVDWHDAPNNVQGITCPRVHSKKWTRWRRFIQEWMSRPEQAGKCDRAKELYMQRAGAALLCTPAAIT